MKKNHKSSLVISWRDSLPKKMTYPNEPITPYMFTMRRKIYVQIVYMPLEKLLWKHLTNVGSNYFRKIDSRKTERAEKLNWKSESWCLSPTTFTPALHLAFRVACNPKHVCSIKFNQGILELPRVLCPPRIAWIVWIKLVLFNYLWPV